jgi:hypothetical protein
MLDAQHLALALANADHGVGSAIDANLLAQRIAGPEHVVDNVGADDGTWALCSSSDSVKERPWSMLRFEIGGMVQVQPRMVVSVVDLVW